jgi:hypothetical protein
MADLNYYAILFGIVCVIGIALIIYGMYQEIKESYEIQVKRRNQ